jgi:hypothetical protein
MKWSWDLKQIFSEESNLDVVIEYLNMCHLYIREARGCRIYPNKFVFKVLMTTSTLLFTFWYFIHTSRLLHMKVDFRGGRGTVIISYEKKNFLILQCSLVIVSSLNMIDLICRWKIRIWRGKKIKLWGYTCFTVLHNDQVVRGDYYEECVN